MLHLKLKLYPHQKEEIWKDIKGYEGLYQVSSYGRVKSFYGRTDFLKPGEDQKEYLRVALTKNKNTKTHKVHRLVAQAFIPNPENKPQINHKNGIKSDNRVENLEWVTQSENQKHAFKNNLISRKGYKNSQAKFTPEEVEYIRKAYIPRSKEFGTHALARKFNVHRKTISRIINNITYP